VEREEAETGGIKPPDGGQKMAIGGGDNAFPSLGDAVKIKETKKEKKKKAVPLSLASFHGTISDTLVLPKGPRSKDENPEEGRNGFRDTFTRPRPSTFPVAELFMEEYTFFFMSSQNWRGQKPTCLFMDMPFGVTFVYALGFVICQYRCCLQALHFYREAWALFCCIM
jgi:hypothetical protein